MLGDKCQLAILYAAFPTRLEPELFDVLLEVVVRDEVLEPERLACHGADLAVVAQPLQDGPPLERVAVRRQQRVPQELVSQAAEKRVGNVVRRRHRRERHGAAAAGLRFFRAVVRRFAVGRRVNPSGSKRVASIPKPIPDAF
ncbi:hypothetical protein DIPPA_10112 [Diplonema papillatum]|nr:hypothetical protein DIPPA_10112 [Diplonema papillatum]